MARSRLELQSVLEEILGSRNVYFQPPASLIPAKAAKAVTSELKYPCILYELSDIWVDHADDDIYRKFKQYMITVIDKDPDSGLPDKINDLKYCEMDRFYVSNNLNHWVFTLYF